MNRRNILIMISILTFIIVVGGISYSYFAYNKSVGDVSLTTGEISIDLSGINGNQTLSNIIPMSDLDGKTISNYFDFTVNSTVDTERIYYEVYILPSVNNTLDSSNLKTYLTDQSNNKINGVRILSELRDSEIENGKVIYQGIIEPNQNGTSKTESKDFRLRIWLDEDYAAQASKTFNFDIYLYAKNVDSDFVIPGAFYMFAKNVDRNTTINFANISSESNGKGLYILHGTENDSYPIYYYRGEVNNNNVIFSDFCWQMVRTTDTGGIKMIYNGVATGNGTTCENTTAESRQLTSTSAFNSQYNSVADIGYMKNTRYTPQSTAPTSGAYFGTRVEYGDFDSNGTNEYKLADDGNGSVGTTLDADHHYSCDVASATGTCATIRYYYYVSGTNYRYINLTNGETVEDALYKMTGNGDATIKARNAGYVLNQNDSNIKTTIESWFRTNLTNEVDTGKRNYASFLEDTVYCNDRSYQTTGSGAYTNSGWNPSGGSLSDYLYFGSRNRVYNGWYSDTNVPTTVCPNETDRFSVSSNIAHLNYPVGLLTADEIVMAGASGNASTANNTYYLYTGDSYWSLSPYLFSYYGVAYEFYVGSTGDLYTGGVYGAIGLRPVVSLKLGTEFLAGGEGTPTNPYVVKYE